MPFNKRSGTLLASVVIALGAISYFSPYWSLYRLRAAVENKDAQGVIDRVDFPALKESVKAEMLGGVKGAMALNVGNRFAAFGQAMAMGVVDQLVDHMISPAGVMAMLSEGKPTMVVLPPVVMWRPLRDDTHASFALKYRDHSTVFVFRQGDEPSGGFIMKRSGLFTWKLSGLAMK